MANIEFLSAKVEEHPQYYDFTKNELLGDCPGMVKLNYDPFPDKQLTDVVRREIIARKLVLQAKLKGDVFDIRPGVAVPYEGRSFAVISSNIKFGDSTADIEAEVFLTPPEPMKSLAALRESLAAR